MKMMKSRLLCTNVLSQSTSGFAFLYHSTDLDEPNKPVASVFLISKHWGSNKPDKSRPICTSVDLRCAQKFYLATEPLWPSQCNWVTYRREETVSCMRLCAQKFYMPVWLILLFCRLACAKGLSAQFVDIATLKIVHTFVHYNSLL